MKLKNCKYCGEEINKRVKICPHCGRKNKKPFYKRWWFWGLATYFFFLSIGVGVLENSSGPSQESVKDETPEIELSTDFEKAVWEIVRDNDGRLITSEILTEGDEGNLQVATILCENDEEVVNKIVSEITEYIINTEEEECGIYNFGDIDEGEDGQVLVSASVFSDGTTNTVVMSDDYKSKRNAWIKSQFSVWDGSHLGLTNAIKEYLNDEKSYEHIATSYEDISNELTRDEINQVLEESGYSQRVEVGDLFIRCEFSAKNGFGGTVKCNALAISSYEENFLTVIAIE